MNESEFCRFYSSGGYLFGSCQIRPSLRLFDAIERDQDKALRRRSVKADYFLSADDVTTAGGCQRSRRCFVDNAGLERVGVVYFSYGNDHVGRRFGLSLQSLNCCST